MSFFGLRTPDVNEWECEYCKIKHNHNRNIHDIRTLPDVPDSFIRQMSWNPNCHCGMQEALHAHRMNEIDLNDSSVEMFKHAPVHDKVEDAIQGGTPPSNVTINI